MFRCRPLRRGTDAILALHHRQRKTSQVVVGHCSVLPLCAQAVSVFARVVPWRRFYGYPVRLSIVRVIWLISVPIMRVVVLALSDHALCRWTAEGSIHQAASLTA